MIRRSHDAAADSRPAGPFDIVLTAPVGEDSLLVTTSPDMTDNAARTRVPLYGMLGGTAIFMVGTAVTLVVVPWFVLETTGSAAQAGVVAACELVPLMLASLFGGPLVERLGRRRTAVLSDVVSAVTFGAVPLLHLTIGVAFWQLCALVAVGGLVRAPGSTARRLLLPMLAERAAMPLERATSAHSGVVQTGAMIGGPVGGVLVALVGPADSLTVTAIGFLLSAALVAVLVPAAPPAPGRAGYGRELGAGLGYVLRDRLVLALILVALVANMLDRAYSSVLLPVYATDVLRSSLALGLVFGAYGVGAIAGAALFGAVGHRLRLRWTLGIAFVITGAPRMGVLAISDDMGLVLAVIAVCGVAAGIVDPVIGVVLLRRVPDRLQASVFGVVTASVLTAMPLGALLGGYLVESVGLRTALLAAAALYLAATVPLLVFPVWRELDARGRRSAA